MDTIAGWVALGALGALGFLAWLGVAVAVGVPLGRMFRRRDQQIPTQRGYVDPDPTPREPCRLHDVSSDARLVEQLATGVPVHELPAEDAIARPLGVWRDHTRGTSDPAVDGPIVAQWAAPGDTP